MLAGPGSGKTRVIAQRIARLIQRGVRPSNLLALTFTNRAAREMATRVSKLLPGTRVAVSTFHSFCARLLRSEAALVGLRSNFSIYDTSDQNQLIRRILHELDFDQSLYPPSKIAARISRAKNDRQTAEIFSQKYQDSVGNHFQSIVAKVYPKYQASLLESNAVDFDDLLLHVVELMFQNPELSRQLDERYRFILVDEYQDTNMAQYSIVASMSRRHQNLCVTGDPDQSIYGWRGAEIKNILRFESEFPTAKVVRLEHNFRSTKSILQAADSLISHNQYRKHKALITENPQGIAVELIEALDAADEAQLISHDIRKHVESSGRKWSDFSVFYRVNSLSREIESAFRRCGIPYLVAASVGYYERAEVKDLLGYLRLIHNPDDRSAFLRCVNKPLRGLGKTSQARLSEWADSAGVGLLEAACRSDEISSLTKRAVRGFKAFAQRISEFSLADWGSIQALVQAVLEQTQYTLAWQTSQSEQDIQRVSNVNEFVTAAGQYDEVSGDDCSLEGFLEATSLVQDTDKFDAGYWRSHAYDTARSQRVRIPRSVCGRSRAESDPARTIPRRQRLRTARRGTSIAIRRHDSGQTRTLSYASAVSQRPRSTHALDSQPVPIGDGTQVSRRPNREFRLWRVLEPRIRRIRTAARQPWPGRERTTQGSDPDYRSRTLEWRKCTGRSASGILSGHGSAASPVRFGNGARSLGVLETAGIDRRIS